MNIITIEEQAFKQVCGRFSGFVSQVERICKENTRQPDEWLSGREVCALLGISIRSLQNYRDSGKLGYSQIGNKLYYKSADIERLIAECTENKITNYQSNNKYCPMEKKEENNAEINQSFKLSAIVGIWESLNLHPTVMIYQSKKKYFLSMLHVSDNGQAKPAVYEIQKEDNRYFIVEAFKRLYIGYDAVKDSISISYYGEYLRN